MLDIDKAKSQNALATASKSQRRAILDIYSDGWLQTKQKQKAEE